MSSEHCMPAREPIFLLMLSAPAHGRDETMPKGFSDTALKETADNTRINDRKQVCAFIERCR